MKASEGLLAGAVVAMVLTPILAAIQILSTLMSIWYGYVLTIIWQWFAVPAFGVKPLSLFAATGLMLICRFMIPPGPPAKPEGDNKSSPWLPLIAHVTGPAITLLCGWILKWILG